MKQFDESKKTDLSNRIELFRHLTIDEVNDNVNDEIFKELLSEYYCKFVDTCDYINRNKNKIVSVSCFIENGEIYFSYKFREEIEIKK